MLRHELRPAGVGVTAVRPAACAPGSPRLHVLAVACPLAEVAARQREFAKLLTMDAADAAATILDAVERRRARALVGWSAEVPDVVTRLFRSSYEPVLNLITRIMARRQRRAPAAR